MRNSNEFRENCRKQVEEFYSKHKGTIWKRYTHSYDEADALLRYIHFLINVQNGMDVDDSSWDDDNNFLPLSEEFSGKRVLIFGAGTGREVEYAKDCGAGEAVGITLGERNKLFSDEVIGVDLKVRDMHCTGLDSEYFDVIVGFHVLEHAYSPIIFLLECNRLLRVGGKVFFETPPSKTHSFDTWLHHILCPTPRQLLFLLMKAGFTPLKYNGIDIGSLDPNDELFDDDSSMVFFEARKEDPETYDRGDIRRFYEVLSGKGFKF